MKVLIIGGGAKEHSLIWKMSRSKHIAKIYCAPGNAGIAGMAECVDVSPHNVDALLDFVKYEWIDLTIVCSETALAISILDIFERNGCKVFGLSRGTLALGSSRVSSKNFMKRHRLPTAEYQVFSSHLLALDYVRMKGLPLVIKTGGHPGEMGVFPVSTIENATDTLKRIMKEKACGESGNRVIIEEHLKGERVSLVVVADGRTILPLGSVYKYRQISDKRACAGVTVWGSHSPAASLADETEKHIMGKVMHPLYTALCSEGIPFRGFISADIVIQRERAYLSELQFGFGDLEPQVILPLYAADIGEVILSASEGRLSDAPVKRSGGVAVSVALFSSGELMDRSTGIEIRGIDALMNKEDVFVFHENTVFDDHHIFTPGGAALFVTALGRDIDDAVERVYRAAELMDFEGKRYKRDLVNPKNAD